VVKYDPNHSTEGDHKYPVSLRVELVYPYFVKLRNAVVVPKTTQISLSDPVHKDIALDNLMRLVHDGQDAVGAVEQQQFELL
jgi:hypothetical protein